MFHLSWRRKLIGSWVSHTSIVRNANTEWFNGVNRSEVKGELRVDQTGVYFTVSVTTSLLTRTDERIALLDAKVKNTKLERGRKGLRRT